MDDQTSVLRGTAGGILGGDKRQASQHVVRCSRSLASPASTALAQCDKGASPPCRGYSTSFRWLCDEDGAPLNRDLNPRLTRCHTWSL